MLPDGHFQALRKIMQRLSGRPILWALTGSTSMSLQGMPLEVHDIDIQTDTDGAYAIDRLLTDFVRVPARYLPSERIHSHFGEYGIDGIEVQVMGDMEKLQENGVWEAPVDIASVREWVEVDGLRIPVISLEHEVEAYAKMGRFERSALIRDWLEKKSVHRTH